MPATIFRDALLDAVPRLRETSSELLVEIELDLAVGGELQVDTAGVTACARDGVLTLCVPKAHPTGSSARGVPPRGTADLATMTGKGGANAPRRDHGRGRARLPRLQRRLPGQPRRAGSSRSRPPRSPASPDARLPGVARRRRSTPTASRSATSQELAELIRRELVDEVVLAYSDLSHEEVMHKASLVLAAGADFHLLGPRATMLMANRPVVAVTAVRTGCGKSQTSRRIGKLLVDAGFRVALVRHPMPYGDLERMRVQRFASLADIDAAHPTVEEREEYEPRRADWAWSCGRASTTARSSRGPRRRPTSSSGTAATTTSRSSSPIFGSPCSTRCGRATS